MESNKGYKGFFVAHMNNWKNSQQRRGGDHSGTSSVFGCCRKSSKFGSTINSPQNMATPQEHPTKRWALFGTESLETSEFPDDFLRRFSLEKIDSSSEDGDLQVLPRFVQQGRTGRNSCFAWFLGGWKAWDVFYDDFLTDSTIWHITIKPQCGIICVNFFQAANSCKFKKEHTGKNGWERYRHGATFFGVWFWSAFETQLATRPLGTELQ